MQVEDERRHADQYKEQASITPPLTLSSNCFSLLPTHTLSITLSHSLLLTFSHPSQSPSLSLTHFHSHKLSPYLPLTHSHFLSLTHSLTHSLSPSYSLPITISLSTSHSLLTNSSTDYQPLTLALTVYPHTHSLPITLSLTHGLTPPFPFTYLH